MCGIAALFADSESVVPPGVIERMTELVAHRGPDGSGYANFAVTPDDVVLAREGLPIRAALGHRRLAILDPTPAGAQPMRRGDTWVTYNGEIYNYIELREELVALGHTFRTDTDTEVILAAYEQWGSECFRRLRGMWGLVLVDAQRRRAVLSRDRVGIKPLYLAERDGLVAVFSEPKQAAALPGPRPTADHAAVARYLLAGYEDPGGCMLDRIRPLPPGTWLEVDLAAAKILDPVPYWTPETIEPSIHDPKEAATLFREGLEDSVSVHLRSDVPVGCALSGGLDSSAIAGLLAGKAWSLQSFTAAFPGFVLDEGSDADALARRIGAASHLVTPSAETFIDEVDAFLWHLDEPPGSLSQYAAYCVARRTREAGVPVSLNGQGGDEALSGYTESWFWHLRLSGVQGLASAVSSLLPGGNSGWLAQAPRMLRRYKARRRPHDVVRLRSMPETFGTLHDIEQMSPSEWRVYEIRRLTLPRLLKWDDRNFMAFSVESRYPFLDHSLLELCLSFGTRALYSRGWTKEPLRRGLAGAVPQDILRRRKKVNFATPQSDWLRGPLFKPISSLADSDSPLWSWLEPAEARRVADCAQAGDSEAQGVLLRLFFAHR